MPFESCATAPSDCRVDSKALVFHPKLWPAVMELTNGKPKLKGGQMIVDDPIRGIGHVTGNGGHLHCAREDWGPESASFQVVQGQIRANDFIVFICTLHVYSEESIECVCVRVRACVCVCLLAFPNASMCFRPHGRTRR